MVKTSVRYVSLDDLFGIKERWLRAKLRGASANPQSSLRELLIVDVIPFLRRCIL